jgi:acyl-CoA dehydrogenase
MDDLRDVSARISDSFPGADTPANVAKILDTLGNERLLALVVPEELGGRGGSLRDAVRVVFDISKASASAGLICAMHFSQLLCLVRHARGSSYLHNQLQDLAARQGLIASVTSEANVNGDIFGSQCVISSDKDNHVLEKKAPNISYANTAESFLVTALDLSGSKPIQRLVYCGKEQTELTLIHENKFMGLQGIVNGAYDLRSTVEDGAVFEEAYPVIARETMTPTTHLLWASVWSGIAARILEKTRSFISRELATNDAVHSEMELRHSALVNKHHVINTLIRSALDTWEAEGASGSIFQNGAQYNRLKVVSSEQLNEICYQALPICGLHGYVEQGPYSLSQHIRDALSAPLMVSNHRLTRYTAGLERFISESP